MGQSSGKKTGTAEESHRENCEGSLRGQKTESELTENSNSKQPQKRRFRFKIGTRMRETTFHRKKQDAENKEEIDLNTCKENLVVSVISEPVDIDHIPECSNRERSESNKDRGVNFQQEFIKEKSEQARSEVCSAVSNEHKNEDFGSTTSTLENIGKTVEILDLLKLENDGLASSYLQENVPEEEKVLLERQVRQLETPIKWFSELYFNDKVLSCSKEGCENMEINKETKAKQNFFHIATYHLCQSAIFCNDKVDYHNALRELSQAKFAIKRFAWLIKKEEEKTCNELDDQRKDQDIKKCLSMVTTSSIAYIAFKMAKYSAVKTLLLEIETEKQSLGSEAAIKGIHGVTLSNLKSALPVAIKIIREVTIMEPNYWRWHMVLSKLLQSLPEPDDPMYKMNALNEINAELKTVHLLRKNDPVCALSLGDSYCDALFFMRRLKNSLENYEEYANLAVDAYVSAVDRAPHCALTHARVARSLWNIRNYHREASKRALLVANDAMSIILSLNIEDDTEDRDQMEKIAEAAMILGIFWESVGSAHVDKALALFRMAASNPCVQPQVAYRSELGLIIGCFRKDNKRYGGHSKANILGLLEKLLEKFKDGYYIQQTLCHKAQYLMDVNKNNAAALDEFSKAISINPRNPYLKKFYPRFTTTFSRPVRVSDLVHDLACKELVPIMVKANKGCPEAIERTSYLNECIKLAKESEYALQATTSQQSKRKEVATTSGMDNEKQTNVDKLRENIRENEDGMKPSISEENSLSVKSNSFPQKELEFTGDIGKVNQRKVSEHHKKLNQNVEKIMEVVDLINVKYVAKKESTQNDTSDSEQLNDVDTESTSAAADKVEKKEDCNAEMNSNYDHNRKSDTGVVIVEMLKKKTNDNIDELKKGDSIDISERHWGMKESYI